jgi:hypothetical protein
MKKFLVVLAVLAMAFISSIALAADVTVSGFVSVRSREFNNLDFNKDTTADNQTDTQEKVRLEVNVKASDDLKGKISIENYWDTWGRLENYQGTGGSATAPNGTPPSNGISDGGAAQNQFLKLREAWMSFNIPGIPVNVTAGHQLLALGNKWFLRSLYFGSDAWVVANVTGNNTIAFVDIKVLEGATAKNNDDADAYALLDVYKIDDNNTVGIDLADVEVRQGSTSGLGGVSLQNIGLNYNGKLGPLNLHAEADFQMGKIKNTTGSPEPKFKGNQIVIQGDIPVEPVTINFTLARGSGNKSGATDIDGMVNFLDIDTHYTYLYEYKTVTAAGAAHTGFSNTTAIGAGVSADVVKSVNVGLDIWYLRATEKVADTQSTTGGTTNDIGTEIDAHVNWKLYDNLTWNWQLGYLDPGNGLGKDAATGVQGYLTFKF